MMVATPDRIRRWAPVALVALALLGAGTAVGPVAAQALTAGQAAGGWDLSFERGNRRCRLTLRPEAAGAGFGLAMPAGCRHAFPLLANVASWAAGDNDHILLQAAAGDTVIDFGPSGGPNLLALVGEAADPYVLTPVAEAVQGVLTADAAQAADPVALAPPAVVPAPGGGVMVDRGSPAVAIASAAAAPATFPPATVGDVAGHYAVLRQTRDTGCMVTLEATGTAKGDLKARLAPACRDQGIVIFDPVGWQLGRGQLTLTARKGHKAALVRQGEHTWATNPAKGPALVLKRL